MKTSPSPRENEVNETTVHAARSPLRNGNRQGDFNNAPRCGAITRAGTPCKRRATRNAKGLHTKCHLHGGHSTGAKSPEGLARIAKAATKHGRFTKAAKEQKRYWKVLSEFIGYLNDEAGNARLNALLNLGAKEIDRCLSIGDDLRLAQYCKATLDVVRQMTEPLDRAWPFLSGVERKQDAAERKLRGVLAAGAAGLGRAGYFKAMEEH